MPPKAGGSAAGAAAVHQQPHQSSSSSNAAKSSAAVPDRTKVIVRKCPPELPEAIFWASVQPHIDEAAVDWKIFKQGRIHKDRLDKDDVESVAYIHFKTNEAVTRFAQAYQGHVFRSKSGQQSQVIVEYAPFQKTPLKVKKPDTLTGTIDADADYLAFVASLNDPDANKPVPAESAPVSKVINKSTPLLEELRRQKQLALDKKASRAKGDKASKDGKKASRAERRAAKEAAAAGGPALDKGKSADTARSAGKKAAPTRDTESGSVAKPGRKGKAAVTEKAASSAPAGAAVGQGQSAGKGKPVKGKVNKPMAQKPTDESKKILLAPTRAPPVTTSPAPSDPPATRPAAALPALASGGFDDMVKQFASKMTTKPAQAAANGGSLTPNGQAAAPGAQRGRGGRGGPARGGTEAGRGRGDGATTASAIAQQTPNPQRPANDSVPARGRGRGRGGPSGRGRGALPAGQPSPIKPTG